MVAAYHIASDRSASLAPRKVEAAAAERAMTEETGMDTSPGGAGGKVYT
jgi:hypothetical protein